MSADDDEVLILANKTAELLLEAVRLQNRAEHRNDVEAVARISAFIAGVSATETACLKTDAGAAAFMLSRTTDQHIH